MPGSRIGFLAFEGMTLLDLVGPLDALSRIASMGFDPTTTCEVVALTKPENEADAANVVVWNGASATARAERYRPSLDAFDLVVVPGGPSTALLAKDADRSPPTRRPIRANRLMACVCTGALLLGAAGRLAGKRATTHASAWERCRASARRRFAERVVDEGKLVTAGGVTSGIDLGLHLVRRRLAGDEAHAKSPRRWRSPALAAAGRAAHALASPRARAGSRRASGRAP